MSGTSSATPESGLPSSAREIERASLLATPGTLAQTRTSPLPTDLRYEKPRHLAHLSRALAEVSWAGDGRMIVTMPPRHGKSETVSRWLPVWFLELWPWKRVILVRYEAGFAASWGRKVRNSIEAHAKDLTVRIAQDSSAADLWSTTEGGGMMTAGVGGRLTGFGADLLILDDAAAKNRAQASSATWRDCVWDWWTSTARPRMEPHGTIVHVQTRWREDDLAGRLLRAAGARDRW